MIEGYFGRQWSWQARRDYAPFLARFGFNGYIYAPKNDAWLRKQWQTPFPLPHLDALRDLNEHYRRHQLDFGIGLSPFELYKDFSGSNRELLRHKLDEINAIAPATLCILFDDMMGDLHDLARAQLEIMAFVTEHSTAQRFVICPTYYSDDPLLTRHFGAQPEHYLDDLGKGLDARIEVFWTGPKVISRDYPRAHLQQVADKLRRKPLLWDNYPVNDAKRLTAFLHLLPFERNAADLRELCSGHLANPMNQAALSQLPLHTLAQLYSGALTEPGELLARACMELLPEALATAIVEDAPAFQHEGLDALTPERREALLQRYGLLLPAAAAVEVVDWLRGNYAFDPACLT